MTDVVRASVAAPRPLRADARRNFEAVLAAAKDSFSENGSDASLEDIARRASVGIGTLYRNFPTRADLITAVYVDEVEALCQTAENLTGEQPWDALVAWLRRFVTYAITKRALVEGLNRDSALFQNSRGAMYGAGEPLLLRAQEAGVVRPEVSIDDVMRLITGIMAVDYTSDEQSERVLGLALDGLRPPG